MKSFSNFINEKYELVVSLRHAKDAIEAFKDGGWKRMAKMQGSDVYKFKNEDDMFGFYDTLVYDWDIPEEEITIEESIKESRKITLKRRYTENHPAVEAGKSARVRNKMLEAIADGKITQEEFNNILKEFSKDTSKWTRRNAKYFNVSEDGISLSTFGKRALKAITVNEEQPVEEGRAFVAAAKKAKDEGKDEFEFDGKTYPVTIKEKENKDMKNTFVHESFNSFIETITEAANPSAYIKAGKLGYNDQFLGRQSLSKTLSLELGLNPKDEFGGGDWLGFDHVSLYATGGKKTGTILDDALSGKYTYDELKAAAADFLGIKESAKPITEATIELDVIDPTEKSLIGTVKKLGLGMNIITWNGPGGGHPAVEFSGKRKDLEKLLDKHFGGKEDFEDFIEESAKPITEATIELDVIDPTEKSLIGTVKKLGLGMNIITWNGPGGGHPAVEFSGKRKDLEKLLDKHFGGKEDFEDFIEESVEHIMEAFSSMKLQSILSGAGSMPKDFAKTFYNMAKIQLDKIQDVDIIEMDPETARKEKRNNAVYLYFTTNEKENPYAGKNSYGVRTIPANTLLGVTDGSNEWLAAEYANKWSRTDRTKTLAKTDRNSGAGFDKSAANDTWGSGISSLTKVAELADRAYVLDLDILRARYSTAAQRDERSAAKAGATAFKSDKDFKTENLARYHDILANRAASMPVDAEVLKAIDVVAAQIKDGLAAGKKGKYGDVIIGEDPKGREVKLRDASNAMQNLLDDFNRYVDYTNQAKREEEAGYGDSYYKREVKNYAKSIKDRIAKIEKMDYVW